MGVATPGNGFAETGRQGDRNCQPGYRGFKHRQVNAAALPGKLPFVKGLHQHAVSMLTGAHVGQRDPQNLRISIGFPGQFHQSRAGLQNRVIGAFIAVGSETGDAQPDDIRFDRLECIVADAQFFVIARQLVGCKNIHLQLRDELIKNFLPFFFRQVQGQGLFTGIDAQIIGVHAFFRQHVVADHPVGITVNRVFQPDDVHPVLG